MPLLNYTTKISAEKTASEIVGILVQKGARNILMDYDEKGKVTSVKWRVKTEHGPLEFGLPVKVEAVMQIMTRDKVLLSDSVKRREQSERVAWRILKDWVEAQMALIESGMVRMEEVFLPYMLSGDQTLYKALAAGGFKALPAPSRFDHA